MGFMPGPFVPGAESIGTTAVTADRNAFLGAATGRTVYGYSVHGAAGVAPRGKLYRTATVNSDNLVTGCFATFELTTGILAQTFTLPGVDCPLGVSVDWTAGQFDLIIYYKDLT